MAFGGLCRHKSSVTTALFRTATRAQNGVKWQSTAALGEYESRFLNGPSPSVDRKV
jgi:hypothetical protein